MTQQVKSSTLSSTGVTPGTYGGSSTVPVITIGQDGRITSATGASISGGGGGGGGVATYSQTTWTANNGSTVISTPYTPGYVQVYMNGVLLELTDFSAANGNTLTISANTKGTETIDVIAWNVSSVSNLSGGSPGAVVYQSAGNTTSFVAVGNTGQILVSAGSGAPQWTAQTNLVIANTQITGVLSASSGGTGVASPGTSGNVLTSTGSSWTSAAPAASGFPGVLGQAFTSSGTFTIPAGVTALKVTVVGGGGNGGGSVGYAYGSGGGGGGTAILYLTSLTPGNTLAVTVGGAGGNSRVASGTQTISTITGGGGGSGGNGGATGGSGGSGSGGSVNINGGDGSGGDSISCVPISGVGGSSTLGVGGTIIIRTGSNGNPGKNYGGGGSGGIASPGGSGAQGIVIFEW